SAELLQEGEEGIGGSIAAGGCAERGGPSESSFFERLIGVDVDLRALYAFVAEPQGDGGGVDSGVEQPHGRGVAKDVRRDRLGAQRWAEVGGSLGVPSGEERHSIAAERSARARGEQCVRRLAATLVHP